MSLKMRAQSHVGITVRDLDASVRFYHEVLGLEICTEPGPWFDEPGLSQGVGVPGAALRQVCLKLGDTMLELLEYLTPPSDTERPLLSHCRGATHVAFQVDDIAAAKAELETRGIEFYSEVNVVDDGVLAGGAGCTSPIPTGTRSSWSRTPTSGPAATPRASHGTWRTGEGETCAPCASTRPANWRWRRSPSRDRPALAR